MASHFVLFVRFHLGYAPPFPFEQFACLPEEEIGSALENLCNKWRSDPANMKAVRAARKKRKDELDKWNSNTVLAVPGRINPCPPGETVLAKAPDRPPAVPGFEEVAHVAGWRHETVDVGTHGITARYPLKRFAMREAACVVAEALQQRVAELARALDHKKVWDERDNYLATANPWFSVASEADLSGGEAVAASEKVNRLVNPPSDCPPVEEGLVRLLLPLLGGVLEQAQRMSEPTTPEGSQAPPGRVEQPAQPIPVYVTNWQQLTPAQAETRPEEKVAVGEEVMPRRAGPEGGRWLHWKGKRHDVPGRVIYRLLAYMWDRDSAHYDDLWMPPDYPVYSDPVSEQTVRSDASELSIFLKKVGVPWRLSADSTTRHLTKTPHLTGKKKRRPSKRRKNP